MPHETPLISTIVVGLVLAFIFGALANRLRMPPLVGYLVAGVAVGPFTPGFVADAELATELSELGVILLMFGVGLHFSLRDLLSVRALAIPGALVQIGGATAMGLGLALLLGWTVPAGLIFGLSLSVASTVVLLKALQDRHMVDSERGRIAVGWLIVEDIAMVLALVLVPTLVSFTGASPAELHDPFVSFVERMLRMDIGLWGVLAVTVVKLAAFVGFMLVVGRRVIPWLLHNVAHSGSRELFRLAVLALALGVAAGSAYLFGVSLALGAFFAGMILSESELSHRAAQETLPLRDAFAVLFFVGVGMLFDPRIFIEQPLPVLGTLFIILIGKSVLSFAIVVLFRRSVATALTISASLAQIGEFSFILAGLGVSLGVLLPEARDLILAGAIASILINPLAFWAAEHFRPALEAKFKSRGELGAGARTEPGLAPAGGGAVQVAAPEEDTRSPTTLEHHTVLIGYGRVGTVVAEGLRAEGRPFVLVEDADARVREARALGIETIDENAATSQAMRLANVKAADTVIVAIPNAFEAGQATEQSRKLNPEARIIVRAHSDEEEAHLKHLGANGVIMGEREIGMGMLDLVRAVPLPPEATEAAVQRALGKALDVGGRGPTGPEYTPPPPSTVTPGARAEIEAALNRALALEAGIGGAGMVAGAGVVPGTAGIAAAEAAPESVDAAPMTETAAAAHAPEMGDVVEAVPQERPEATVVEVHEILPEAPALEASEEERWLHEPALEPAALQRAAAEQEHAGDLPEDEDEFGALPGGAAARAFDATAEATATDDAAEAAEWAEDLARDLPVIAQQGGTAMDWSAEQPAPPAAPDTFAALPPVAGDAAEAEAEESAEPRVVEPYPDYWGLGTMPATAPIETVTPDKPEAPAPAPIDWDAPAGGTEAAPGAPGRPTPPDTEPEAPPPAPDLPPPVPDDRPEQPEPTPEPWWTPPPPEVPQPGKPPIVEPGDFPPIGPDEVPDDTPSPERGPMPPPSPPTEPPPVAAEADGGDEPPPAPFRMPRPGQGNLPDR